jgi:hypothetical protein
MVSACHDDNDESYFNNYLFTFKGYEGFTWEKYLSETKASPMPPHLFQPLPPVGFKRGMRIECVDTVGYKMLF